MHFSLYNRRLFCYSRCYGTIPYSNDKCMRPSASFHGWWWAGGGGVRGGRSTLRTDEAPWKRESQDLRQTTKLIGHPSGNGHALHFCGVSLSWIDSPGRIADVLIPPITNTSICAYKSKKSTRFLGLSISKGEIKLTAFKIVARNIITHSAQWRRNRLQSQGSKIEQTFKCCFSEVRLYTPSGRNPRFCTWKIGRKIEIRSKMR